MTKKISYSILAIILIPLLLIICQTISQVAGGYLLSAIYHIPLHQLDAVINTPMRIIDLSVQSLGEIAAPIILLLIFYKTKSNFFKKGYFKEFQGINAISLIIFAVGFNLFASAIMYYFIAGPSYVPKYNPITIATIVVIITSAIIAPIVEELLFRGFLFSILKNNCRVKVAIFFQAISFAFIHLVAYGFTATGYGEFIIAFITGIVFAVVLEKTNSFYNNLAGHVAYNLFGSFFGNLLLLVYYSVIGYAVIGLILVIIAYFVFRRANN